jgi:hypothetical protein
MTESPAKAEASKKGPLEQSTQDEVSPFYLKGVYPDPQGLLDTRYESLEEIKDASFVVLGSGPIDLRGMI